jgi:hypothetical protein
MDWKGEEGKRVEKLTKVYYVDVQNTLNIREKNDVFLNNYISFLYKSPIPIISYFIYHLDNKFSATAQG